MGTIAVSGASPARPAGGWCTRPWARACTVRALVRPGSELPEGLGGAEVMRLELGQREALHQALRGCDALVIATGARPSVDLSGPLQVDAIGVRQADRGLQGRWA
jgi:uncharacterized protein YbjT (DUF2867 family)